MARAGYLLIIDITPFIERFLPTIREAVLNLGCYQDDVLDECVDWLFATILENNFQCHVVRHRRDCTVFKNVYEPHRGPMTATLLGALPRHIWQALHQQRIKIVQNGKDLFITQSKNYELFR